MAKKRKNITRKQVRATEDKPYEPKLDLKPELDEGPFDEEGLSVRQRQFVAALIGPAGGNATKAAEMAGYASENRKALGITACRLLGNARVAGLISRRMAELRLSPEWVKSRLASIAAASMDNFLSRDSSGERYLDFDKASELGAMDQLKEYHEEGLKGADGEVTIIKRRVKIYDPQAALATLARVFGLLNDNGGQNNGGVPLEKHPAAGRVKAPSGTEAADNESGSV